MWMHNNMINNIDKQYNTIVNNNSNVACYLQLEHNEKNIKFQNNNSRNEKRINVIPRINLLFSIYLFILNGNTRIVFKHIPKVMKNAINPSSL